MVEKLSKPVVVITGVTGFLGSQVLNEFLNGEGAGKFQIRATVRDKNNAIKMKPLQDQFGDKLFEVQFFNADLNNAQQLDEAIKGCDFVVHTASPVGLQNTRNHDDMIRPAVNGVKFCIEAAQKHKIKRVVITSSVAAVSHQDPENALDSYDETSWSDLVAADYSAYVKSKTIAERAAWDFQKQMKDTNQYCPEIVTICPSLILGEVIGSGEQTSSALVRKMMMNEMPGMPALYFTCVDVKDCALAHVRALTRTDAANQRFILSDKGGYTMLELADQLQEGLVEAGFDYNISRRGIGYCTLKFASYFSSDAAALLPFLNRPRFVHINTKSREILGIEYKRSTKECLTQAGLSLIASGSVPRKPINN